MGTAKDNTMLQMYGRSSGSSSNPGPLPASSSTSLGMTGGGSGSGGASSSYNNAQSAGIRGTNPLLYSNHQSSLHSQQQQQQSSPQQQQRGGQSSPANAARTGQMYQRLSSGAREPRQRERQHALSTPASARDSPIAHGNNSR